MVMAAYAPAGGCEIKCFGIKFEPGREAEVVPEDKKVHGLYVYGTFMNPF